MIGNGYWTTGITVKYGDAGGGVRGWGATLNFYDDGFCDDDVAAGVVSTQGTLTTRYTLPAMTDTDALTAAVDAVKADADRLGIRFGRDGSGGTVYMEQDGELPADRLPAAAWWVLVNAQAERLGWASSYTRPAGDAEVSR